MSAMWRKLPRGPIRVRESGDQKLRVRAGLEPHRDGCSTGSGPGCRSHHAMEASRERPAPLGRHFARWFHELEGQGWRHQLVVPEERHGVLLQRLHGGAMGAHLGTAHTLALAEQGFYWPGMRADVSRICMECDCAMLKRRRG